MRIAVLCNDTRGGIQPYVALGVGLQRAGHEVRAVAPADFAPMFAEAGLPLAPLSGSTEAALRSATGVAARGTIASMRFAARELTAHIQIWTRETLAACKDVDVLTGGVGGMVIGLSVAEKLARPFIEAHLQPVGAPTDAYPGILLPGVSRRLGSFGLYLSHYLSEMALWMPFQAAMASARQRVLRLSGRPLAANNYPVLYGFSRYVLQVPVQSDRPRHVTGYWVLPAPPTWKPSPALEVFLTRDGPVVSIGFGSMANDDPAAVTALVLGAVRKAGVRAVLLCGWGGLASLGCADDVFFADALPNDWLFPRVTAVVHHGGAGTTGAALRAGVPALVVPFTMDQPFWGARVAALGAGPTPIARARLTQERLADSIRQTVADERMRARAALLGVQIREENGVAEAGRSPEPRKEVATSKIGLPFWPDCSCHSRSQAFTRPNSGNTSTSNTCRHASLKAAFASAY
ncbi:glycosyltransferase [Gloeobacter violaceus]|uniref:Glr2467 protein n=1 Tax=Gloeobacter violaceus (strain ATCC 29082 / PCC 7421) TaxID=251221 RepID=Q7NHR8_GLOVI|nr:glr2467 [Gloeobacter violaceus PCC 7421]